MPDATRSPRPRWSADTFSLAAFGMNALCLVVLLVNLVTGNAWWQAAIVVAGLCLLTGGVFALLSRRLRHRARNRKP